MRIDSGDTVLAADGTDLGKVRRVVLHPGSGEVTHLVVSGGFLREDRVVPAEMIDREEDERTIRLAATVSVDDLPLFEERYTVPVQQPDQEGAPSEALAWYWPYGVVGAYPTFLDFGPPPPGPVVRNIAEDTVPLEVGAAVRSSDDVRAGEVAEVVTNPQSGRVESFVVESGVLFRERTLIPIGWVEGWEEDEIRLSVDSEVLGRLPPYEPA